MKQFCVVFAFALLATPATASNPVQSRTAGSSELRTLTLGEGLRRYFPPTPMPAQDLLLNAGFMKIILFPDRALVRWGRDFMLTSRIRGPQTVAVETADLDIPIHVTRFGKHR
jgi:hypothetical protein